VHLCIGSHRSPEEAPLPRGEPGGESTGGAYALLPCDEACRLVGNANRYPQCYRSGCSAVNGLLRGLNTCDTALMFRPPRRQTGLAMSVSAVSALKTPVAPTGVSTRYVEGCYSTLWVGSATELPGQRNGNAVGALDSEVTVVETLVLPAETETHELVREPLFEFQKGVWT
jgi:hypothetical protein